MLCSTLWAGIRSFFSCQTQRKWINLIFMIDSSANFFSWLIDDEKLMKHIHQKKKNKIILSKLLCILLFIILLFLFLILHIAFVEQTQWDIVFLCLRTWLTDKTDSDPNISFGLNNSLQHKDIQFTVTESWGNQQIFTFEKLETENLTQNEKSADQFTHCCSSTGDWHLRYIIQCTILYTR